MGGAPPPLSQAERQNQQEAPRTLRPWSLWSPFSYPSFQKEVDLGATQGEKIERSQTSKFRGLEGGPSPSRQGLSKPGAQ